jgi:hypothetical protein
MVKKKARKKTKSAMQKEYQFIKYRDSAAMNQKNPDGS